MNSSISRNNHETIRTGPWQKWIVLTIDLTRPKTLFAGASGVILGVACAYAQGIEIDLFFAAMTLLCALLLQILANIANDYFDGIEGIDSHRKHGPKRATQSALIRPIVMKRALIVISAVIFILAIPLIFRAGPIILLIGLIALASAFLYTTTAISFSRHALGELSAGLFFGPVAVWGSAFIQGTLPRDWHIIFVGLIPGLMSASIMAINNLRDMESDAKCGKTTLAIIVGLPHARLIPVITSGLAYFIILSMFIAWSGFFILPWLTLPFALRLWKITLEGPIDESLNFILAQYGKLMFFVSVLLSLSFVVYAILQNV